MKIVKWIRNIAVVLLILFGLGNLIANWWHGRGKTPAAQATTVTTPSVKPQGTHTNPTVTPGSNDPVIKQTGLINHATVNVPSKGPFQKTVNVPKGTWSEPKNNLGSRSDFGWKALDFPVQVKIKRASSNGAETYEQEKFGGHFFKINGDGSRTDLGSNYVEAFGTFDTMSFHFPKVEEFGQITWLLPEGTTGY